MLKGEVEGGAVGGLSSVAPSFLPAAPEAQGEAFPGASRSHSSVILSFVLSPAWV